MAILSHYIWSLWKGIGIDDIVIDKKVAYEELSDSIKEIYPEFKYDGNIGGIIKYFRSNYDDEVDIYRPTTKKWELLSSDESKLPVQLRKSLGWSQVHINRYNKGKTSLDMHISLITEYDRDGNFDIRKGMNGFPEVLDVNKGKWYSLFTKVGEDFKPKSFGKMTDRIKNILGPSAEQLRWMN